MTAVGPNIIVVTTDQQRTDSMGCYGSAFASTPNLDAMAAEGLRCDRAYTTNPVCTPSRASLYSGRYVSSHGAWNVGTKVPETERLLSHRLADRGYRTHLIGKAHFQPFQTTPDQSRESRGWDDGDATFSGPYYGFETTELALGHSTSGIRGAYGQWVRQHVGSVDFPARMRATGAFGAEAYDWELPVELHQTRWIAERTEAFLDQRADDRPFLLSLGFQDPHHPHAVPTSRSRRIDTAAVPLPAFTPGELDDKPPHFAAVHEGSWSAAHPLRGRFPLAGQEERGYDYRQVPPEDARLARAYYYELVAMVDDAMGQILRALDERGLAENTIVVFTTDHGELLGDHGLWLKGPFCYEQLVRVPLLLRWPAGLDPGVYSGLISFADLVPTILGLAGLDDAEGSDAPTFDGQDLSESLCGRSGPQRRQALIEHVDDPDGIRLKTVVTDRHKRRRTTGPSGVSSTTSSTTPPSSATCGPTATSPRSRASCCWRCSPSSSAPTGVFPVSPSSEHVAGGSDERPPCAG